MKKKLFAVLIAALLVLSLIGCGKKEKILGKWYLKSMYMEGLGEISAADMDMASDDYYLEFKEDGTFSGTAIDSSNIGTWEKSDDKYIVTITDYTYDAWINHGDLYIDIMGIQMIFED